MIKIKLINDENLERIKGGSAIAIWTGVAITTAIIFLCGVIEGIVNPKRCNE